MLKRLKFFFAYLYLLDFKIGTPEMGGEGYPTFKEKYYSRRWGFKTEWERSEKEINYSIQEAVHRNERDRLIELGVIDKEVCNLGHDQREFMCFNDIHLERNRFKK